MCDATLVFPCKVPLHLGHSRVTIWGFEHMRDLSDLSRFIIGCSLYDRVVIRPRRCERQRQLRQSVRQRHVRVK